MSNCYPICATERESKPIGVRKAFQATVKVVRRFSSDRLGVITVTDDWYVVLHSRKRTEGKKNQVTHTAGRQISLFTMVRRQHNDSLFARHLFFGDGVCCSAGKAMESNRMS
ncbi:hypothetical protein TNIN_276371 [Trichonephila inaurata madagascariensis]|uniref:Uncharacterized protein n=1 Tax=Trichonephila inaurata madagascariensis TaxID=2747483 RepID=A0A8X7BU63_9ARAC|nr:hypothetical protein TNIN_276371 [Trichonephila inaurata madagascariensis]